MNADTNAYRAVSRMCLDLDICMIGLIGIEIVPGELRARHVDAGLNITMTTIPIAGQP